MTAGRFQIILSTIAAVISLAGLADATYLTVTHLTGDDLVCGSPGGCSAVLSSVYASVAGIPTAAFGALAYFVAFSSATLAAFWLRTRANCPHARCYGDVRRDLVAAIPAGVHPACLLPFLPAFGRTYFLTRRHRRRHAFF
jgi:hypothetical protein